MPNNKDIQEPQRPQLVDIEPEKIKPVWGGLILAVLTFWAIALVLYGCR